MSDFVICFVECTNHGVRPVVSIELKNDLFCPLLVCPDDLNSGYPTDEPADLRLCVATGALVVIKGAISAEPGNVACGALITLFGLGGLTLLFVMDIYDHLRGVPLPHERELVQAVASLHASEAPELNPLDRHYRHAAAEQEVVAAAEALVKARGWS